MMPVRWETTLASRLTIVTFIMLGARKPLRGGFQVHLAQILALGKLNIPNGFADCACDTSTR